LRRSNEWGKVMTRYGTLLIGMGVATTAGLFAPDALAQAPPLQVPPIITGFPASENVGGGALSQRAPGRMVQAGVARAQEAVSLPGPAYNITETLPTITPRTAFLVTAIQASFAALDQALTFFVDLLFRRAGLPPPTTGGTTGGDTGGTTGDTGGTTGDTGGTTGGAKPGSIR
jgi:hypothetical protein